MGSEQVLGANSVIFLMLSNLGPEVLLYSNKQMVEFIHCCTFNDVACLSPRDTVPIGLIKGMYSRMLQYWRNSGLYRELQAAQHPCIHVQSRPDKKLQSCKTFFLGNSQFLWGKWLRNQQINYHPQTKFAKVMFLRLSVSHSFHKGGGVCLIACWDIPKLIENESATCIKLESRLSRKTFSQCLAFSVSVFRFELCATRYAPNRIQVQLAAELCNLPKYSATHQTGV